MLELASDLDIPKGGEGWHILRQGELPLKFLEGINIILSYTKFFPSANLIGLIFAYHLGSFTEEQVKVVLLEHAYNKFICWYALVILKLEVKNDVATCVVSARSPKLKYIIGKMLVPDYSTRPTVDQLLAMSSLKKVSTVKNIFNLQEYQL